ncbi:hypothetical protein [Thalassococcus sp. S3]|uniref:hypothetical protein n=1 Tax=Thalassococcus sp. S3 TaxID=2017482 RepID=UPI001024758E|nr:hypothetical protein [Thalassococcus sp. S3]QBF31513.1 hypothetical protein CFI11_09830 [Thalassococcus sp. S3]
MKNWPVEQVEAEKRRGAILKHLKEAPGGQLSLEYLKIGCTAQGIPSNIDQVKNAVVWLQENDLARLETLGSMELAVLMPDGKEVVQGVRMVRGVLDPDGGL